MNTSEIVVTYIGERLSFSKERPSVEQIVDSDDGPRLLAGFLLRRTADSVRSEFKAGKCTVHLHYDH